VTAVLPAALAAALGAGLCLAGCGPDTVSAPTVSATPRASATPSVTATPVTTNTPTPPASTTPAAPVSTSGPIGQTMTLDPGTVAAGSAVRISGYDPSQGCGSLMILSRAFPGPQEFAGVPAVTATIGPDGHFSTTVTIASSMTAGAYPVTGRACGGNFGTQLTLTVTR
jgi:hypothetical protein